MVKFRLEGTEYSVPEFINIEQYVKIVKLKDLLSEEYYAAKLVSIVTNASVQDLMESDYDHVTYLAAYILNLIPKEIPKFKDKFELDGVKYGFFPKWQDLTYAEFVDMDTIVTRKEDEMLNMLHILAAVMYRPIVSETSAHNFEIEKYDVKTMVKRAELFKEKLNVRYVLGAQSFFLKLEKRYLAYSHLSLIPKITFLTKIKLMWKWRKIYLKALFKNRSGGISLQTDLLEMILQSTTTSIKKP